MIKNISGEKFGRITVINFNFMRKAHSYWNCICECGEKKVIALHALTSGSIKSCGCLKRDKMSLKGKRFSRVIVLERVNKIGKNSRWVCLCDCGKEFITSRPSLVQGKTISCGCYGRKLRREISITHNKTNSRVYRAWACMKSRCLNKNCTGYKDYGGRGITICDRWINSFENFYYDMGDCLKGMSLERKNVNLGYSPKNCKWIPISDQGKNKRSIIWVKYNGKLISSAEFYRKNNFKLGYDMCLKHIKRGELCKLY